MAISDIDQETQDLEWFAIDACGSIGFFTTGGVGVLPATVAVSANDQQVVADFFWNTLIPSASANLSDGTQVLQDQIQNDSTLGQFRDWLQMAARGLYGFDYQPARVRPTPTYNRVTVPTTPLRVELLPHHVQEILARTVLSEALFAQHDRVTVKG
jgi:hypothetical protein